MCSDGENQQTAVLRQISGRYRTSLQVVHFVFGSRRGVGAWESA